jgi:hypothetical protein
VAEIKRFAAQESTLWYFATAWFRISVFDEVLMTTKARSGASAITLWPQLGNRSKRTGRLQRAAEYRVSGSHPKSLHNPHNLTEIVAAQKTTALCHGTKSLPR